MIKPIRVITLKDSDKEAHMMGDCVAVCWKVVPKTKVITKDGIDYKAEVYERTKAAPYIDFINLREHDEDIWEDEDSPIRGGMNIKLAEKIHKELGEAIEYLKSQEK